VFSGSELPTYREGSDGQHMTCKVTELLRMASDLHSTGSKITVAQMLRELGPRADAIQLSLYNVI